MKFIIIAAVVLVGGFLLVRRSAANVARAGFITAELLAEADRRGISVEDLVAGLQDGSIVP